MAILQLIANFFWCDFVGFDFGIFTNASYVFYELCGWWGRKGGCWCFWLIGGLVCWGCIIGAHGDRYMQLGLFCGCYGGCLNLDFHGFVVFLGGSLFGFFAQLVCEIVGLVIHVCSTHWLRQFTICWSLFCVGVSCSCWSIFVRFHIARFWSSRNIVWSF